MDRVYQGSIKRILVTITVDPEIPNEKIFLNISYAGTSSFDESITWKSGWNDSAIITITNSENNPCYNNILKQPIPCSPETSLEFYKFMGEQWMESKKQEMLDAFQSGRFHDWIDQTENHYHLNVYKYYSYTEDLAKLLLYPTPYEQHSMGVEYNKIKCNNDLVLIQKYDGLPVCVTESTRQKLIERGWTKTIQVEVNHQPETVYTGATDIPRANNQFAIRFYSHVSQENTDNVFFSPASIFTAFAIAYEGAGGNTAKEMQDVFGFEPDDSTRHKGFENMQQRLNFEGQNNTLSIANALWLAKNFDPYEDYLGNVENYYSGKVESVDFASQEKSLDVINQWVYDNTDGKIEKIFDKLRPDTKLAITNAIYFKGIWQKPFEKNKTTMAPFHVIDGTTVTVPMMELKTTYLNQTKTPTARILELPYEGNKISMLILLPNEIDGIHTLEDSLSAKNIDSWQEDFAKIKTKAYLPKFKLETGYDLIPPLVDLGVHDAFYNADFSDISELGLHTYKAKHKAFVEVNEEGTEAAAATGMAMLESGPVEFRADHPFVFVIQDNETGQILFMGRVMDPTT